MDPLFSVIVLSYNQRVYYKTALQSVLKQTYPNIELIFADDASSDGTQEEVTAYLKEIKQDNIKNGATVFHGENVGTVRNVNDALKKAHGEYILFFAADDALYDEHVLENFRKSFETHTDADLLPACCLMMDTKLEKAERSFIDEEQIKTFNSRDSHGQFEMLARECILAMGATAFRASTLKKFGFFDERYRVVEDWPWLLGVLRKGGKAFYESFGALLHRDGGISHSDGTELSKSKMLYNKDVYSSYINEILPFMKGFAVESKIEINNRFLTAKTELERFGTPYRKYSIFRFDPVFALNMKRWEIMRDKKALPGLIKLFAFLYVAYFALRLAAALLPSTAVGIPALSNVLAATLHSGWIWVVLQLFMAAVLLGIVGIVGLHVLSAIKKLRK